MRHDIRALIESKAQALLREAGEGDGKVDVERLAALAGAAVHYHKLEDHVSGALMIQGESAYIVVNKLHPETRRRFTIAHEIGHLVLHHDANQDRLFVDAQLRLYQRVGESTAPAYHGPDSQTTPEEEREANAFAAALLMPEISVRKLAFGRPLLDEESVAAMARTFAVSEQAMSIRLQRLHIVEPSDAF